MAAARAVWKAEQPTLDPARLVFIDETGTSTNMARTRGRDKHGQRVIGRVPWGHWKILTFVAGLRQHGITAPFVIDRAMTRAIFIEYLRQCLVPTLKPGDIVVMDNLPAHKGQIVQQIIAAAGAELRYLPPIPPISIRSSRPSPSSNPTCAKPSNDQSTPCGNASEPCSTFSAPKNAQTSSQTTDMLELERIPL